MGLLRPLFNVVLIVVPLQVLAGTILPDSANAPSQPLARSFKYDCVTERPGSFRPAARLVGSYGFEIENKKTDRTTFVNAFSTPGRVGKGIKLNGANAYARIDTPSWPRGDYTYGIWVWPRLVGAWRALLEIQTPESKGLELAVAPGGYIEIWSSGRLALRNGTPLRALTWTHVAVTRNGTLITLFLDGVAQRVGRDRTVFDFGSCPALIGVDADFSCAGKLNGFFSGVIDDLRVYDCALSERDIGLVMKSHHGSGHESLAKP